MEDDAADEEGDGGLDQSQNTSAGKRGTVLVTLRNVAPYTQWLDFCCSYYRLQLNNGIRQGCPSSGEETSGTNFGEDEAQPSLHSATIIRFQQADVEWL
jgi:hypothetical protein